MSVSIFFPSGCVTRTFVLDYVGSSSVLNSMPYVSYQLSQIVLGIVVFVFEYVQVHNCRRSYFECIIWMVPLVYRDNERFFLFLKKKQI